MGTRWVTWIDGRAATVELLGQEATGGGRRVRARVEDGAGAREVTLQLQAPRPNGLRALTAEDQAGALLVRGMSHVGAPAGDGERPVRVGDERVRVKAVSELDAWLGSGEDAAGAGAVTVAMPGRVVKLMARVGDAVEKGQPLLIIEAMKMENEVKSRRAGTVKAVLVSEGESVEGGRTLVEVGD
jgi:biotin carboxyl carrier protein